MKTAVLAEYGITVNVCVLCDRTPGLCRPAPSHREWKTETRAARIPDGAQIGEYAELGNAQATTTDTAEVKNVRV